MKKDFDYNELRTMDGVFEIAQDAYSYYPEDFDYKNNVLKDRVGIFDKVAIFYKEDADFWRGEKDMWDWDGKDLRYLIGKVEIPTAIVLPANDSESMQFDELLSVVCVEVPCPKEGLFYDYFPMVHLLTNDLIEAIYKID